MISTWLTKTFDIKYPIILAPMFLVCNNTMLIEAYKNGFIGWIPALNYRSIEEFEVATKQGAIPIPVGATGYASEELWNKVMTKPNLYYPNNSDLFDALKQIGDKTLTDDELINHILTAISILQNHF